tara:strand:+ start:167 stop:1324 length:1158 start_codon:yes stop_codon:yes gene_type:complete
MYKFKYKGFGIKKNFKTLLKELNKILLNENEVINSLKRNYKYNYSKELIKKLKNYKTFQLVGMGGSILGSKAIYEFLKKKIKKKIIFFDDLDESLENKLNKDRVLNIIISKSGNTLETISNANLLLNKKSSNLFITEKNNNPLRSLAKKLKADIVDHNNYIGGRYSVLSEVGMIPSELIGLNEKKFKQYNNLIKNNKFINILLDSVASTLYLYKKGKSNSVILNYDSRSENLFKWYQQLIAESLGKKSKGILPIISNVPKDNHSTMQLFLDGKKNNFFTFFFTHEKNSKKIIKKNLPEKLYFLNNQTINSIKYAQKKASEKVFLKKKIPFRSFEVFNRDENTLGELFTFFILETILLGRALKVNPYDQPAVELIKKQTKFYLSKK